MHDANRRPIGSRLARREFLKTTTGAVVVGFSVADMPGAPSAAGAICSASAA